MDKCEELLPDYFGFVRGVVDSSDLTLNISRETLQHNGQLRAIARRLEKKIKADLVNMRDDDREAYEKFFEQFGRTLKFGIYQSYGMAKDTLGDLLLFYSAKQQKMITLDEYLAAAPAGADSIFYAAGDSAERLAAMPLVTTVLAKGYDVLLCDQDVDEFCMMAMGTYGEHAVDGDEENKQPYFIKNVGSEDLGLTTDEEKKEAEEATESNARALRRDARGAGRKGGARCRFHSPYRCAGRGHKRGRRIAGYGAGAEEPARRRGTARSAPCAGDERQASGV